MVYSRPSKDQGAAYRRKTRSYQAGPAAMRKVKRVMMAAARGIPRNTPTLVATTSYEMSLTPVWPLMTRIKKTASGAKRTIWRIELMATRMAQYSSSPPARPFQMRTSIAQLLLLAMGGRGREVTNHGNASSKANEDQADTQIALVGEESPCKAKLRDKT